MYVHVCIYFYTQTQLLYKPNTTIINSRDALCHCNYKRAKHSSKALQAYDENSKDWSVAHDTEPLPTDGFGEIQFVQFGSRVGKVSCDWLKRIVLY